MRSAGHRRLRDAAVWMACATALTGMGQLGDRTAAPGRDVRATLTDVDGTRVEVNRLTVGGETHLEGDLGRGRLRVPFEHVQQVTLTGGAGEERDRVRAVVTLRDGAPVTLLLRGATTFYGQTDSGAYSIRARDLRSITLRP